MIDTRDSPDMQEKGTKILPPHSNAQALLPPRKSVGAYLTAFARAHENS